MLPVGKKDKIRLEALNAICNPVTLEFIEKNRLNLNGKVVADIGCGIGIMTTHWAELVGDSGQVIAIDNSEEQLALAKALADSKDLQNITEAKQTIFEYIEVFYNRKRIHSANDYLSPAESVNSNETHCFKN